MKKILAIIMMFSCLSCIAAAEGSDFMTANEVIRVTVDEAVGGAISGEVYLTDLMSFYGMLMYADGDITADAEWDMYVSGSRPELIRWVDDHGAVLELDISVADPFQYLSYTAPGGNTVIYDAYSYTAIEVTAAGIREMSYDEAAIWVTPMFNDGPNGEMYFGAIISESSGVVPADDAGQDDVAADAPGFGGMLLMDRDGIRIYMTGEYVNYGSTAGVEVVVENNTDRALDVEYSGSMNGWEMIRTSWGTLRPGTKLKDSIISFDITDPAEIETMELIFEVSDMHLNTNQNWELLFTCETGLIDLRAGTVENSPGAAEAPAQEYAIGDTVSTDMMEFTLTGFDFVYHLDPASYAEKADNKGGSLGPGRDMVFANPEYTVRNVAKQAVAPSADILFTVVYGDGYQFGMNDGEVCYVVDAPYIGGEYTYTSFVYLELSPLSTETYEAYIPANVLIDTDVSAPLWLVASIMSSDGPVEFVYRIR